MLALVDSLSVHLLKKIWLARRPVPNLRVSAITTGNLDAIRAYLKGQRYYRRAQWDSAQAAFQEAVDADSTFALAHFRLSLAYGWTTGAGWSGASRHGAIARRLADRLPARERSLVVANELFEEGRLAAYDTMRAYVMRYPDDPEGWYQLGDVAYEAQPLLGLSLDDLLAPFDHAVELDSSFTPALLHPLELCLQYDDSARYRRYLSALEAVAPPSFVEPYRMGALFWEPSFSLLTDSPIVPRMAEIGLFFSLWSATFHSTRVTPVDLLPIAESPYWLPEGSPQRHLYSLTDRAVILASLGRLAEARTLYDSLWIAVLQDTDLPREAAVLKFNWRLGPVIAGHADSAFAGPFLEGLTVPPSTPVQARLYPYYRMLYALSQGRADEARELGAQAIAADTPALEGILPALVDAALGWADVVEGDTAVGLSRMESGLKAAGYHYMSLILSLELQYVWARTLTAWPETREKGIRLLRYNMWNGAAMYVAPSYLVIGRALEEAGDRAGAARAYAQFVHLWENADPELQPQVETARRALERLAAEGGN